jgi:hypothetical protein
VNWEVGGVDQMTCGKILPRRSREWWRCRWACRFSCVVGQKE